MLTECLRPLSIPFIAALLALAGCGDRPAEAPQLSQARQLLGASQAASAVAAAKAAVAERPESAEARLVLGLGLLAAGDAVAAEIELNRALEQGQPADEVLPALAQALLAQRKFDTLLGAFAAHEPQHPAARAVFLTQLAEAQAIQGRTEQARQLLARALQDQPQDAGARLLESRFSAVDGQMDRATRQVEELLASAPDNPDAWLFKADLLAARQAPAADQAQALHRALALRPDLAAAHAGLITLAMRAGDTAAAQAQHKRMAQALPDQPTTLYYEALLAEATGDQARVRELSQLLLRHMPQDVAVLMLGGRAALSAGAYGQATALLGQAARLAPKNAEPSRLLAQAYIRTGWPDKALAALQPFTGADARDADALVLAAQAWQLKGQRPAATALYRRAQALRPDDTTLKLKAAVAAAPTAGADPGITEALQSLAGSGRAQDQLALFKAQFARRDLAGASRTLEQLSRQLPDSAVPDELRGQLALLQRDREAARAHFERALGKRPDHFAAVLALVQLDMAAQHADAAQQRLEAFLGRVPRHLDAQLARAAVLRQRGAPAASVHAALADAVRTHPGDPKAHLALIAALETDRRPTEMLVAARAATAAIPDHVDLMDLLGRAQMANSELLQAETTFKRLAALQSDRAQPYVRLAEVQLMRAQTGTARDSLRQARQVEPDDPDALRALAAMALRDGRPVEALQLAQEARRRWPQQPLGLLLEADVAAAGEQWPAAEQAYRAALALQPGSPEITQRLHDVLIAAGKPEAAEQWLATWVAAHPGDLRLWQHLASDSLARRNWPQAEERYRQLLTKAPNDALVLNNLAVALTGLHKAEAVPLAEKAVALSAGQPEVLDTLAQAYAEAGQLAKAIDTQRRAVTLAPHDRGLLLTLAKLQLRAGEAEKARESFIQLTRIGLGTPLSAEAEQLRQTLGLPAGAALQGNAAWQAQTAEPTATRATAGSQARRERLETLITALLAVAGVATLGLVARAALGEPFLVVDREVTIAIDPSVLQDALRDLRRWDGWSTLPAFGPGVVREHSPGDGPALRCLWAPAGGAAAARASIEVFPPDQPGHVLVEHMPAGSGDSGQLWDFELIAQPDGGTRLRCTAREAAGFSRRLTNLLSLRRRRIGRLLSAELARLKSLQASTP